MRIWRLVAVISCAALLGAAGCDDGTVTGDPDSSGVDSTLDSTGGGDAAGGDAAADATAPDATTDAVPRTDTQPDGIALPDEGPTPDTTADSSADVANDEGNGNGDDVPIPTDVVPDGDAPPTPDATPDTQPDVVEDTGPGPDTTPDVVEDTGPDVVEDTGPDVPPTGESSYTHITHLLVPSEASAYMCDSDGNGTVNAEDGALNDLLGTLSGFGVDANAQLTEGVADGSLTLLLEFMGYTGGNAEGVTTNLFIGADIDLQPDPTCGVGSNLEASCDWYADPDSYDEAGDPLVSIAGTSFFDGEVMAGPATIGLSIPIGGGIELDLQIGGGRIEGLASGSVDITDGRICGAVPKSSITDGVSAACEGPDAPSFCDFAFLIDSLVTCDPCTIVIEMEGSAATSVGPLPF